ncbi:MAG: 50S ribosomal protein L10 [Armatimonadota bacterium]
MVAQTRQWYEESVGVIFTDYRGLSVPELQALRNSLRDVGAEYHVIKNTLLRLAMGSDVESLPPELHNGPTATAFILGEQPAVAKTIVEFAKTHKQLEVKGALIEGRVLSKEEVEELARLPSRQELLAMIAGLVAAPMSNLVGVLNEVIAAPIRVIAAIEEKVAAGGVLTAPTAEEPNDSEPSTESELTQQTEEEG